MRSSKENSFVRENSFLRKKTKSRKARPSRRIGIRGQAPVRKRVRGFLFSRFGGCVPLAWAQTSYAQGYQTFYFFLHINLETWKSPQEWAYLTDGATKTWTFGYWRCGNPKIATFTSVLYILHTCSMILTALNIEDKFSWELLWLFAVCSNSSISWVFVLCVRVSILICWATQLTWELPCLFLDLFKRCFPLHDES